MKPSSPHRGVAIARVLAVLLLPAATYAQHCTTCSVASDQGVYPSTCTIGSSAPCRGSWPDGKGRFPNDAGGWPDYTSGCYPNCCGAYPGWYTSAGISYPSCNVNCARNTPPICGSGTTPSASSTPTPSSTPSSSSVPSRNPATGCAPRQCSIEPDAGVYPSVCKVGSSAPCRGSWPDWRGYFPNDAGQWPDSYGCYPNCCGAYVGWWTSAGLSYPSCTVNCARNAPASCSPTSTATSSSSSTQSRTSTASSTSTQSLTSTSSATSTQSLTSTSSSTATSSSSSTQSLSATSTATGTQSCTASSTSTSTGTNSASTWPTANVVALVSGSVTIQFQGGLFFRHCGFQGYACPLGITLADDYNYVAVPALNGNAGAVSFRSVNYPSYYIAPGGGWGLETTRVGMVSNPNANDASWMVVPGLADGARYSLRSLSVNTLFKGLYMTVRSSFSGGCTNFAGSCVGVVLTDGTSQPGASTLSFPTNALQGYSVVPTLTSSASSTQSLTSTRTSSSSSTFTQSVTSTGTSSASSSSTSTQSVTSTGTSSASSSSTSTQSVTSSSSSSASSSSTSTQSVTSSSSSTSSSSATSTQSVTATSSSSASATSTSSSSSSASATATLDASRSAWPVGVSAIVRGTVTLQFLNGLYVRHCGFGGYACPFGVSTPSTYNFVAVAALNNNPNAVSFYSEDFPSFYLTPGGNGLWGTLEPTRVGVLSSFNADDASWLVVPGLADGAHFSLRCMSTNPEFAGLYLTVLTSYTGCTSLEGIGCVTVILTNGVANPQAATLKIPAAAVQGFTVLP